MALLKQRSYCDFISWWSRVHIVLYASRICYRFLTFTAPGPSFIPCVINRIITCCSKERMVSTWGRRWFRTSINEQRVICNALDEAIRGTDDSKMLCWCGTAQKPRLNYPDLENDELSSGCFS